MNGRDGVTPRVLFVDDDPAVCRLAAFAGKRLGIALDTALEPRAALEFARSHRYDVIATDLSMPDLDGIELVSRVHEDQRQAAYLVVTGTKLDIPADTEASRSIAEVLRKPFEVAELEQALGRALQVARERRALSLRAEAACAGPGRVAKVLFLEDDPAEAERTLELLAGYEVARVCCLSQALAQIGVARFDVALLDLSLPDGEGLEVLGEIHLRAPELPVVLLAEPGQESLSVRAFREGAQDLLVKGSIDGPGLQRSLRYAIERKRAQHKLAHLALYDQLTGLANRTLFRRRLQRALHGARRTRARTAVLFVDLDRFKQVNDTLGHDAGDALLREVAARLRANVRETDTVARLGGDEFAVALVETGPNQAIADVAARLRRAVDAPILVHGRTVRVSASIGIATSQSGEGEVDHLLRCADLAMFRAKSEGRGGFQFFCERMHAEAIARLELEDEVRAAWEGGRLRLHYQPLIEAATRRVVGAEALLRWARPGEGLVSAAPAIPILEETGLIVPVGRWVLEQACRDVCRWRAAGGAPLRVSVNVSARQLDDDRLVDVVRAALERAAIPGSALELEITETALMRDADAAAARLGALKRLGVRLSIDDFGTGYSSLAYLHRFAVDTLKVDGSFVRALERDAGSRAIVQAVLGLGRSLGLEVVAECVETEGQLTWLRTHGCDLLQGYLCGRPMPAAAVAAALVERA